MKWYMHLDKTPLSDLDLWSLLLCCQPRRSDEAGLSGTASVLLTSRYRLSQWRHVEIAANL
jgi:hypothetical protein